MSALTISIPIDDQSIYKYQSVPTEKQERTQQFVASAPQSLFALMDDISEEAEFNGLTPELLDEILNET